MNGQKSKGNIAKTGREEAMSRVAKVNHVLENEFALTKTKLDLRINFDDDFTVTK